MARLVGLLNLNASLTKMGRAYSTIWGEDLTDPFADGAIAEWLETGRIEHDTSHVRDLDAAALDPEARALGRRLADELAGRMAILGVFDEGCMGMYNAIFDDEYLNPMGIYKERLSQSALLAEMRLVDGSEARAAYRWLLDRGMEFRFGKDGATELTEDQVLDQLRLYIAAVRIADRFGCDAIRRSRRKRRCSTRWASRSTWPASTRAGPCAPRPVRPPSARSRAGHGEGPGVAAEAFDHWCSEELGCDSDPSGCRHDPQLDEHAQLIDDRPMLGQAPVGDLRDVHLGPTRRLVGRRDAHELTLHRARGGHAMDDPVAALEGVLDHVAEVREGHLQGHCRLLEAITRRGDAGLNEVVDEVRCEELVDEPEVAVVEDFERNALDHLLGVRGHVEPPMFRVLRGRGRSRSERRCGHPPSGNFPGTWSVKGRAEYFVVYGTIRSMSTERLTSTSYLVLGLLAREGPSTPYELERHVRATIGNFWSFPHTLLYTEPPRLAVLGLVAETRETEGRRRRIFTIRPDGESALAAWLDVPSGASTELRDLGLLQLFFADLTTAESRLRLAEQQLALHNAKLVAYQEDERLERRPALRTGQATVERWRGETLRMGLLYELAAVEFWTGAVASARLETEG